MFAGSEKAYNYKYDFAKTTCSKLFNWEAREIDIGLTIEPGVKSVLIKLNEGVPECKRLNFTLVAKSMMPLYDEVYMEIMI